MMPIKDQDIENQSNKNNILLSTMMVHPQQHQQQQSAQLPTSNSLSKAEIRKNNKPIMEKKRRARINHCLNELKTLILEALKKDPARHTKLEKADILEMTVKHLQTVQRKQVVMSVNTDPSVVHKFKSGFSDCAEEVTRYISQLDGIDTGVKQRLSSHLKTCISGLQQTTPFTVAGAFNGNLAATVGLSANLQGNNDLTSHNLNNNRRIQMGEMQLIPSRLPTGELALIMPNSSNLPFFPTSAFAPPSSVDLSLTYPRMSAFNSVSKTLIGHMSSSPPLSPMSSISCCDDDSLQSSDYHPLAVTPPLQNNLSNLFPTPPSGGSSGKPSVSNLQQAQVSSTTETTAKTQPLSVLTNNNINLGNNTTPNCRPDAYVNKKRPYPVNISDSLLNTSNDYVESPQKIQKLNPPTAESSDDSSQNSDNEQNQFGANDAMWRPW